MSTFLRAATEVFRNAPEATRTVALLAIGASCVALALCIGRALLLHLGSRQVTSAAEAIATSAEDSRAGAEFFSRPWMPHSFRWAIHRLASARQRPVGAPEEAWRASFELIANTELRWEALIRGMASAVVLSGLFGTVLGFAGLAKDLVFLATQTRPATPLTRRDEQTPALTSEGGMSAAAAAAQDAESWRRVHTQLGGAFASTLAGILGSLAISLLGLPLLRSAADRWLEAVEGAGRIAVVPFLPRPPTELQDLLLEELKRRLDTVAEALRTSLQQPVAQLTEGAATFARAAAAITTSFRGVDEAVGNLKDLGKSASRIQAAAKGLAAAAASYENAASSFEAAGRSFAVSAVAVSDGSRESAAATRALQTAVGQSGEKVSQALQATDNQLEELGLNFKALESAVVESRSRDRDFITTNQELLKATSERILSLREIEDDLRQQTSNTVLALVSLREVIGDTLTPLAGLLAKAIDESFGRTLRQHAEHISALVDSMERHTVHTKEMVSGVNEVQSSMVAAAQEFGNHVRQISDIIPPANALHSVVSELQSETQKVGAAIGRQTDEIKSVAHALIEQIIALRSGTEETRPGPVYSKYPEPPSSRITPLQERVHMSANEGVSLPPVPTSQRGGAEIVGVGRSPQMDPPVDATAAAKRDSLGVFRESPPVGRKGLFRRIFRR